MVLQDHINILVIQSDFTIQQNLKESTFQIIPE